MQCSIEAYPCVVCWVSVIVQNFSCCACVITSPYSFEHYRCVLTGMHTDEHDVNMTSLLHNWDGNYGYQDTPSGIFPCYASLASLLNITHTCRGRERRIPQYKHTISGNETVCEIGPHLQGTEQRRVQWWTHTQQQKVNVVALVFNFGWEKKLIKNYKC